MNPHVRWMTCVYEFDPKKAKISVPEEARDRLIDMKDDLFQWEGGLVAIYIPEREHKGYNPPKWMRGRVVGAVRLVEMPKGKTEYDYPSLPRNGSQGWLIGWPCEVVYAPDQSQCPSLRELAVRAGRDFYYYAGRLQIPPIELDACMKRELDSHFSEC